MVLTGDAWWLWRMAVAFIAVLDQTASAVQLDAGGHRHEESTAGSTAVSTGRLLVAYLPVMANLGVLGIQTTLDVIEGLIVPKHVGQLRVRNLATGLFWTRERARKALTFWVCLLTAENQSRTPVVRVRVA